MVYYLSIRSFECVNRAQNDIFSNFSNVYKLDKYQPKRKGLRSSIIRNHINSEAAQVYPKSVAIWSDRCEENIRFLKLIKGDYKLKLKRKLLKRILAKGTEVCKAVTKLNDEFYHKFR